MEHYWPKSRYWWLAYTYDNYLFACQICNQHYKSDNFPIRGVAFPEPAITATMTDDAIELLCGNISPDPVEVETGFKLNDYLSSHYAERALLLNPYFDDPTRFIGYQFDDNKQEVIIIPAVAEAEPYIKAMEDFYGINRIELRNLRYRVFSIFRILKKAFLTISEPDVKNEIRAQLEIMLSSSYTFAGMNRFFNTRI